MSQNFDHKIRLARWGILPLSLLAFASPCFLATCIAHALSSVWQLTASLPTLLLSIMHGQLHHQLEGLYMHLFFLGFCFFMFFQRSYLIKISYHAQNNEAACMYAPIYKVATGFKILKLLASVSTMYIEQEIFFRTINSTISYIRH